MFCIRGGEEQRQLGPCNFIRSYNPEYLTYIKHGSINYSASTRAKDLHYENKDVPCSAIPEERPNCLVFLMDFYQSKLPPFAFENNLLYLTLQAPNASWYDNFPVGKIPYSL